MSPMRPDASSVDDRTQDGQRPVESRELLELTWADRTRPVTLDWTHETQCLVESRELLEPLWVDLKRPVTPDRTLLESDQF